MITIKLQGGLGNQLFQYALGRRLSLQGKEVVYDIDSGYKDQHLRTYGLDAFNTIVIPATHTNVPQEEIISNPYGSLSKLMRFLKSRKILRKNGVVSKLSDFIKSKIPKDHHIAYSPEVLKTEEGYLTGFWQSYEYIDPIRETLLKEITLKDPIETRYAEIIEKIKGTNSVSLHVRRGDYVSDPVTKKVHVVFGMEYYEKALEVIKEKVPDPIIFVFSDDIEWVKNNLKIDLPILYASQNTLKDYEELILMSLCKHNIIANSSFSFWAAWLNQNTTKIVIGPSKWANKKVYGHEFDHILPPAWIKIR